MSTLPSGDDCDEIANLTSLRSLEFIGVTFEDPRFSRWGELRQLERFRILNAEDRSEINAEALSFAAGLPLVAFAAEAAGVDDRIVNSLSAGAPLRQLSLRGTAVGDPTVDLLLQRHQFEQLDLSNTETTDQGLYRIANQRELIQLNLSDTGIGDATLTKLIELRNLKDLDISRTACSPPGLRSLEKLQGLEKLGISQLPVDEEVLARVAALPSLQSLHLIACGGVTREGLEAVVKSRSLQTLLLAKDSLVTEELVDSLRMRNDRVNIRSVDPEWLQ